MKTNIVIDISPVIPYPVKFWFSSYMGQNIADQSNCRIL